MLLIATSLHIFVYLSNDILDLELDRQVSRRQQKPLVRGAIQKNTAIIIAAAQLPLMVLLTALFGGRWFAVGLLISSAGLLWLYNRFGKQMSIPPMTDSRSRLACALLVWFGAVFGGGKPTRGDHVNHDGFSLIILCSSMGYKV